MVPAWPKLAQGAPMPRKHDSFQAGAGDAQEERSCAQESESAGVPAVDGEGGRAKGKGKRTKGKEAAVMPPCSEAETREVKEMKAAANFLIKAASPKICEAEASKCLAEMSKKLDECQRMDSFCEPPFSYPVKAFKPFFCFEGVFLNVFGPSYL